MHSYYHNVFHQNHKYQSKRTMARSHWEKGHDHIIVPPPLGIRFRLFVLISPILHIETHIHVHHVYNILVCHLFCTVYNFFLFPLHVQAFVVIKKFWCLFIHEEWGRRRGGGQRNNCVCKGWGWGIRVHGLFLVILMYFKHINEFFKGGGGGQNPPPPPLL